LPKDTLDAQIAKAMAVPGPYIVHCVLDPNENVYPMIPAGGCNHEMILEDPPALKNKPTSGSQAAPKDSDTILTA